MRKRKPVLPEDGMGLLRVAQETDDPVLKEHCLLAAEAKMPDSLPVKRELLMLGNLARRNAKQVDFSVIKCYILHPFEHPEQHTEEEMQRLIGEIFHHDCLNKCLLLADDREQFLKTYLEELCRDYLHIFIEGQREHAGGYFGIQFVSGRLRALSRPCADMLMNMLLSPFLTEEESVLLTGVFYRSCLAFLGRSRELDALLPAEIRERIR